MHWSWLVFLIPPTIIILRNILRTERGFQRHFDQTRHHPVSGNVKSASGDSGFSSALDLRSKAIKAFDRGCEFGKSKGKDEEFCYKLGIMESLYSILADDMRGDAATRMEIQMETVPFNLLPPEIGKSAVIEYLVWKIFPSNEDASSLRDALMLSRSKIIGNIESDHSLSGDGKTQALFEMISKGKYDWQKLMIQYSRNK